MSKKGSLLQKISHSVASYFLGPNIFGDLIFWWDPNNFWRPKIYCQAQGQGQSQSQRQTSKLDPEVGSVMGWPTHHRTTFFELKTAN